MGHRTDDNGFLKDVFVVELGDRSAVGACGSLLAELGATVLLVEHRVAGRDASGSKWECRPLAAAGKRSAVIDYDNASDRTLLHRALARADVVLASPDRQADWVSSALRHAGDFAICCDVTAFGTSGPLTGRPYSDTLIQALTGIMDTSGDPDGPPIAARFPMIEFAGAIYATAGIVAALRVRRVQGEAQPLEIALFDCAFTLLTTFLPAHFVGRASRRIGNHHPSMSPWNAYRAKDGWLVMCLGSDDQWKKITRLIGQPDLATDPRYGTPTQRVSRNEEVDGIVEAWTQRSTVDECIQVLSKAGLPCGPVYRISDIPTDPSLVCRGMVREMADPLTGRAVRLPGSVFRGDAAGGRVPQAIQHPDEDRAWLEQYTQERPVARSVIRGDTLQPVLADVRVLEIGNYTTAPFCARQLAALGADVVKVEPPGGDLSRPLPPLRDGQGYFFTMSNSDKRSLMLDLRSDRGKEVFRLMLSRADVLVENLKPGSLARLGFGPADIASINPKLVYCAVSGFGLSSPFADRAAMDTTIQGMSGIMDLTRLQEVPYKTGVSIADLAGGQMSLVAILAALEYRDRVGRGIALDLSMQDSAAWLTHGAWNRAETGDATALLQCADGYVVAEARRDALKSLAIDFMPAGEDGILRTLHGRSKVIDMLGANRIAAAPVLSVSEVVAHEHTQARGLIVTGRSSADTEWPLLASPLRLRGTPPHVARAMGNVGAETDEVMSEWLSDATVERER